ncbi:MAG: hypothetical protein A3H35_01620 [Betaproteobacteria bacterium RIFCSPLOWO2_02_FULL_62_17]|nr:MAG: hypothetical protein A3H35_01620 [Betaproteobacteria bacterium RIFCSPLOWO2_02_FULL_62_17]
MNIAPTFAAAAALLLSAGAAVAAFPEKPIQVVVGFPGGAGADASTRALLAAVTDITRLAFVVDNRAGAGGIIAANHVAKAAPDGYTLLNASSSIMAVAPLLHKDLGYQPLRDFAPVAHVANHTVVLLASSSFPASTLGELIQLARKQPGKITYATPGVATTFHLTGEWLNQLAGISLVNVPYKNIGQALTDVSAGRVPLVMNGIVITRPFVRDGKLKIIAVGSDKREAKTENAPTFAETHAGMVPPFFQGIYAPAKTPPDVLSFLSRAFLETLKPCAIPRQSENSMPWVSKRSPAHPRN